MRWKSPSESRRVRGSLWHHWFAWRPVRCNTCWVWLETVQRRCYRTYYGGGGPVIRRWEYRVIARLPKAQEGTGNARQRGCRMDGCSFGATG